MENCVALGAAVDRADRFRRPLDHYSAAAAREFSTVAVSAERGWLAFEKAELRRIEEILYDKVSAKKLTSALQTAGLAHYNGAVSQSLSLARNAAALAREVYPVPHPNLAIALRVHALAERAAGNYSTAIALLDESLAMTVASCGAEHPHAASACFLLAESWGALGDSDFQLVFLESAYMRQMASTGPSSDESLEFLARLVDLKEEPDSDLALAAYEGQLSAYRASGSGESTGNEAQALQNLATLRTERGDLEEARLHFTNAIEIWKSLGRGQPSWRVANCLSDFAKMELLAGNAQAAIEKQRQAIAICSQALFPEHQLVGTARFRLGGFMLAVVDLEHAAGEYESAALILSRDVGLGDRNAQHALAMHSWAKFIAGAKRDAVSNVVDALELYASARNTVFPFMTERQRIELNTLYRERFDQYMTMTYESDTPFAEQYAHVLRWKGVAGARFERALDPPDASDHKTASELQSVLGSISSAYISGKAIDLELISRRRELERKLRPDQRGDSKGRHEAPSVSDVCRALSPDEVLLDFVEYSRWLRTEEAPYIVEVPRLACFVLTNDSVERVELGAIESLEQTVAKWKESNIAPPVDVADSTDSQQVARSTYRAIITPIESMLAGRRKVYISPDGPLSAFPFAALQDRSGQYLVERFQLCSLISALDLLTSDSPEDDKDGRLLLVGGIDYQSVEPAEELAAQLPLPKNAILERRLARLSGTDFASLPG